MVSKLTDLLYLSNLDISKIETDGVSKKIYSQIMTLKAMGYKVSYIFKKDKLIYIVNDSNVQKKLTIDKGNFRKNIYLITKLISRNRSNTYQYIYIRKSLSTFNVIRSYKILSKLGKVILEIPVFPYKGEKNKGFISLVGYYMDSYLNKLFLNKYVNLIVNYNGYNERKQRK